MSRETRRKRILKLSVCAMLIGISVVVGALCRTYLTFGVFVRITFENLPIILSGILFGPVSGAAVGICTDLISSVMSAQDINPIITVGAASVGLVSGCAIKFFGNKKRYILSSTLACVFSHVVGSLVIKTFGLKLYYFPNVSFWYLFAIRLGVYTLICASECAILVKLLKNKYIKGFSDYDL